MKPTKAESLFLRVSIFSLAVATLLNECSLFASTEPGGADPFVDPTAVFSSDPIENIELKIHKMFSEYELRYLTASSAKKKELAAQFEVELNDRIAELELLATLAKKARLDLSLMETNPVAIYRPRSVNEQNLMRLADFYRSAAAAGADVGASPMSPDALELLARGGGRTHYSGSELASIVSDREREVIIKTTRLLATYDPHQTLDLIKEKLEKMSPEAREHLNVSLLKDKIEAARAGVDALNSFTLPPNEPGSPSGPPGVSEILRKPGVDSSSGSKSGRKNWFDSIPWPQPILTMAENIEGYFQRRREKAESRRIQKLAERRMKELGRATMRRYESEAKKVRLAAKEEVRRQKEEKRREKWQQAEDRRQEREYQKRQARGDYYGSSDTPAHNIANRFLDLLGNIFIGTVGLGAIGGSGYWWYVAIHSMVSSDYYFPEEWGVPTGVIVVPLTIMGAIAGCSALISRLSEAAEVRRDRAQHPWRYDSQTGKRLPWVNY